MSNPSNVSSRLKQGLKIPGDSSSSSIKKQATALESSKKSAVSMATPVNKTTTDTLQTQRHQSTSNSLKSSVKRLFSPSSSSKSNQSSTAASSTLKSKPATLKTSG